MQEKSWLTTVVGIGEKGHILLREVKSRMESEKDDTTKNEDIMLCHFWHIPTGSTIAKEDFEENCRGIAIAFLLMDVSNEESVNYAQRIAAFIGTQPYAVSIAILMNSCDKTTDSIFSSVDAVVDLNACVTTGGFTQAYMAYCVIRGINGLIVKPGLIGLDVADLNEQFQKAGLLHAGFDTARLSEEPQAMRVATEAALSQISNIHAERVLLCMEGNASNLDMQDITASADMVGNSMPDANIVFGATASKSAEDMVRVLILTSEIPLE